MKIFTRSLTLLALATLVSACGSDRDGNVSVVEIENGVWADIVYGESLRVEGDVSVDRDGDVLRLAPAHGNDAVARVRLPYFFTREIRTRGNAEVVISPLRLDQLELDASGTSRIEVSGITTSLVIHMRGNAEIEASQLVAATASIDGSGNSLAEITATISVGGTMSGSSEIIIGGGASTADLFTSGNAEVTLE